MTEEEFGPTYDIERSILSAYLDDPGHPVIHGLVARLPADAFATAAHRSIFLEIQSGLAAKAVPDEAVLKSKLPEFREEITELSCLMFPATNVDYYCDELLRHWRRQHARKVLSRAIAALGDEDSDLESVWRKTANDVHGLLIQGTTTKLTSLDAAMKRRMVEYVKGADSGVMPWTSSGVVGLDELLGGGFRPSTLNVIAARPSCGKSALALSICLHFARLKKRALYFSLEMSEDEIADRALSGRADVSLDQISRQTASPADVHRLIQAAESEAPGHIFFESNNSVSADDIAVICAQHQSRHGLDLIIVDYMQLIPADKRLQREQQVSDISRKMKILAMNSKCTVLALSQLNRKAEDRQECEPMLSDLRESGSIEQDADNVIMIWPRKSGMTIKLTKARNQRVGQRDVVFTPRRVTFE